MAKQYILRVKEGDDWVWHLDDPCSKREANSKAATLRIIGGMTAQIWPYDEAVNILQNSPGTRHGAIVIKATARVVGGV